MRYLSVCSGIEAATCAWRPLGWTPVGFSEIEKFPAAVLAYHYPEVPNLGDMTRYQEWPDDLAPDLLVGGTPCQSFSVAGLRKGLDDPRGNLMLTFGSIARATGAIPLARGPWCGGSDGRRLLPQQRQSRQAEAVDGAGDPVSWRRMRLAGGGPARAQSARCSGQGAIHRR